MAKDAAVSLFSGRAAKRCASSPSNGKVLIDGQIVRLLLRRRGIRQGKAAKLLRVSDAQFFQYLEGKTYLKPPTLAALCRILELNDPSLFIILPETEAKHVPA